MGGTGGDADDREGKDTPRLGLASCGVLTAPEAVQVNWWFALFVGRSMPQVNHLEKVTA